MARASYVRRSEKSGLPPGTPAYVGAEKQFKPRIMSVYYDEKSFELSDSETMDACPTTFAPPAVRWVHVEGIHDAAAVERLCGCFGIHPLTVEDILNTHQRPKIDFIGNYVFIVLKLISLTPHAKKISTEQFSIIMGHGFVLTFGEKPSECIDLIKSRLSQGGSRIRQSGADFLAYSILDSIVDDYFETIEAVEEQAEMLEGKITGRPTPAMLQQIHGLRRELIMLRKSVRPMRDIVDRLHDEGSELISQHTYIYIRDLYDHTVQVMDAVDTYRDILTGMLETYLTGISNRMNEVMKLLSVIATIFIPLTFIAGVYGMNFEHMPELRWRWGYFGTLGLMAFVGVSLLLWFRKNKWL